MTYNIFTWIHIPECILSYNLYKFCVQFFLNMKMKIFYDLFKLILLSRQQHSIQFLLFYLFFLSFSLMIFSLNYW